MMGFDEGFIPYPLSPSLRQRELVNIESLRVPFEFVNECLPLPFLLLVQDG